jgi:hypothetical protein
MKPKDKTLSVLILEADRAFSTFIRFSVAAHDGRIRCFICSHPVPWKSSHCGHFIDRDQMPTRYDEMNCHPICYQCNCVDPLHKEKYAFMMMQIYGPAAVAELREKSKGVAKYMRHELIELIDKYKERVKELNKTKI